jgi:hypothetical protein
VNDNKGAAKILRDAAEYIGEHGWIQGDLEDEATGSVCALGAINNVVLNGWNDCGALVALTAHLGLDPTPGFLHPIAKWNDAKERTAEDVILAFKRTAEELER